jgi:hypothetical protein
MDKIRDLFHVEARMFEAAEQVIKMYATVYMAAKK